jgi:hypothetical protein
MLTDDGGDSGVWPLLHGLNNSHRLRFVLCAYHVQLPRQHWWCNLLSWTPLALPMPKRDCSRGPVPTGPLHFIREKNLAQRHAGTEAEAASVLINQSSHTLSMTIITKQQSHGDRAHVGGSRTGQTSRKLHLLGLDLRWQQDGDWVCHCKQYSTAATSTLSTPPQNAGMKRPLPHTRILCSLSFALALSLY